VRWATLVTVIALSGACNDVRDFRGTWQGDRVGDSPVLRVGGDAAGRITLVIDNVDSHGIQGRLSVESLIPETSIESIPGAEADALANMTFAGNPVRVYLAFVPAPPAAGGDALAFIALFDDERVEVRLLRSGSAPLYAIYALKAG
jgi:hypothetical protein